MFGKKIEELHFLDQSWGDLVKHTVVGRFIEEAQIGVPGDRISVIKVNRVVYLFVERENRVDQYDITAVMES